MDTKLTSIASELFGDRQQTFQNAKSGYLECYIGHLERDTNSPTNKIDEPSSHQNNDGLQNHGNHSTLQAHIWGQLHEHLGASYAYFFLIIMLPKKSSHPKKSSPHHNNKALFLLLPRQYRIGTQQKVWGWGIYVLSAILVYPCLPKGDIPPPFHCSTTSWWVY
jgi:hypothetical protein